MKENDFGVTGIHKLVDMSGNDLTWFASGGRVIDDGSTVWIAGSVKDHSEFNGRKQTILSRVVVLTEEEVNTRKEKAEKKAKREAKKLAKV